MPDEYELCAQLHVSGRTVRVALEQLCREVVVKSRQGKRRQIVGRRVSRGKLASHRVVFLTPLPLQSLNRLGLFLIDCLREHQAEEGYLLETHASRVPYRARVPQELKNLQGTLHPAAECADRDTLQAVGSDH